MSATRNKFSPEFRDRAVRMVEEHRGDYPSEWAAMSSIAAKVGCTTETLRRWRRHNLLFRSQRRALRKTLHASSPVLPSGQPQSREAENQAITSQPAKARSAAGARQSARAASRPRRMACTCCPRATAATSAAASSKRRD